eukprot:scaffold605_cov400-Prasinococcus_capsulatus_cf.AAC.2
MSSRAHRKGANPKSGRRPPGAISVRTWAVVLPAMFLARTIASVLPLWAAPTSSKQAQSCTQHWLEIFIAVSQIV